MSVILAVEKDLDAACLGHGTQALADKDFAPDSLLRKALTGFAARCLRSRWARPGAAH